MLQLTHVQYEGRGFSIMWKSQRNSYEEKKNSEASHIFCSHINNATQGQLALGEWFLVISGTTSEAK